MKERLAELGYAAGWRLVRALPLPVARAVFTAAADLAYLRKGRGVRRLAGNLRQVVGPELPEPQLRRLVRAGMRSYARYWMEAFRLPTLTPEQIQQRFRLENEQLLRAAVQAGNGVIVALPHAGNWDLAGAWAASQGWPLTTVAERLRPESLYERFVAYREGLGMRIIPTTGGQRTPLELLVEALDKAHIVALLADRDLSARGIDVEFFGARARMPAGPAILALRTAAPLFAVEMWYEADAACARLRGPLPVPQQGSMEERVRVLTQRLADEFAAGIAAHPVDWHMLQRIWLDSPPSAAGGDAPTLPS
ncbi:MAG TPA: phosphatidylinositol mannoside acyltransferase [Natronosporangium sp.]|nr:phosphatidylinositol mannoside acyltransferase [Natronosporangium sp.]